MICIYSKSCKLHTGSTPVMESFYEVYFNNPSAHADVVIYNDSSRYAPGPIRRCLFIDYIIFFLLMRLRVSKRLSIYLHYTNLKKIVATGIVILYCHRQYFDFNALIFWCNNGPQAVFLIVIVTITVPIKRGERPCYICLYATTNRA